MILNKNKQDSVKNIKFNPKKSLRLKLSLTMILAVIIIIILCWGINKLFLQRVYEKSKLVAVEDTYKFVNKKFTEDILKEYNDNIENGKLDNIFNDLERVTSKIGLAVTLYKKYEVGHDVYYEIYYPTNNSIRDRENFKEKLINSSKGLEQKNIIKQTNDYIIYKKYDNRLKFHNLELIGNLDSGISVNININFAVIEESARISNKFLATIGLLVGIIASIILYFISNSITKPMLEVSSIARKMANLEFDVKYKVTSDDEIGELGNSINSLSSTLEKNITELKNANTELKNDIRRKEKMDEMRREFLSNVSHELKTPIAVIQGYAEGLSENINEDIESRQFYIDVIIDETQKMSKMVKKLLDLNQIEFGESNMEIVRFDIVEMIQGIAASTGILFKQKGVDIEFNRKKKLYVWADQYMIEEVLTNYISNALNHVDDDKKIKIEIKQDKEVARICVFNSGKPIPESDIDRIWEKFYKVDKSRTREYGGNGVGLSIVKAIMEKHDRKYGVNNLENGVEFWFELDIKA